MAHTSECDGKTRGLGRTLVIANPVAHSGQGEGATQFVERFLSAYKSATSGYRIARTGASGDATGIAADASDFDTVIALGGDGVIHEVAEGLMAIDPEARPRLGIIPMGTGNDYARTLGMARNDPEEALRQLVGGREKSVEVGRVNGRYFVETLSFGLDAAIALDTTNKRANETSQEGTELFVRSAIRILSRAGKGFPCTVSFDGADPIESRSIIFAFQVGPTYGRLSQHGHASPARRNGPSGRSPLRQPRPLPHNRDASREARRTRLRVRAALSGRRRGHRRDPLRGRRHPQGTEGRRPRIGTPQARPWARAYGYGSHGQSRIPRATPTCTRSSTACREPMKRGAPSAMPGTPEKLKP